MQSKIFLSISTTRGFKRYSAENQIFWNNDDRFKERLISLLNDTGVDITDIVKVENEDKSVAFVYFEHTVNNNKYRLSLDLESNGTKKLLSLLPYVMKAFNEGRLLNTNRATIFRCNPRK